MTGVERGVDQQLCRGPELDCGTRMDADEIELLKPAEHRAPSTLFHYTTAPAFQSIVEKQELWASDWRFLNDRQELTIGFELIDQLLQAAESRMHPTVFRKIREVGEDLFRGRKFKGFDYCLFVCSFTSSDDLLSQWRGYGSGRGISIGVHRSFIIAAGRSQNFSLRQVSYVEAQQVENLQVPIETTIQSYGDSEVHASVLNGIADDFWQTAVPYMLSTKHRSFSEEKEWRLIAFLPSHRAGIRFRSTESSIVPYMPIKLRGIDIKRRDTRHLHAFRNVMLGPGWHTESVASVRMLLAANDVGAEVTVTSTPFIPQSR